MKKPGSFIKSALILCALIFLILTISVPLHAETIVVSGDSASDSSPNDIVKWCEEGGEGVRYSSANIDLKGYKKCGELKAQKTCDATGQRFISPGASKSPHGYLDCEIGPRIYVKRHLNLESDVIEFQDFREDGTGAHVKNEVPEDKRKAQDPMSDYMQSLDRLLQSNFQNANPDIKKSRRSGKSRNRASKSKDMPTFVTGMEQYEKMLEPYLRQHGISPDVLKAPRNKREARKQQRAVKKLFDSLDPQSRKLVEQFLGGQDLDKLLNHQSL